jgi:hypothetical protein
MYEFMLFLHNLVRWVALILAIVATVLAFMGWFGRREWAERDRRIGSFYAMAMDIQLLLGLLLYFIFSPITRGALANLGAAMSNPDVAFFAVEHAFSMFLAVIFAHLGSATARRAPTSQAKFKRAAIFFAISLVLLLIAMPWMRPLFRLP